MIPTPQQQIAINSILQSKSFFLATFEEDLETGITMHRTTSTDYNVFLAKTVIKSIWGDIAKYSDKDGDEAVKWTNEIVNHPR